MRFTAGLVFIASAITSALALKNAPTELQIGVLKRIPASECTVKSNNGDTLSMHYTGTLFDTGAKFDSSLDRNDPFVFELGAGRVIQGWDKGLVGMCVGEKRKLTIPPHLGYGDQGAGGVIPPKATLVFEVELLEVKKGNSPRGTANKNQPVVSDDENIISFTSPSFILSTAGILGLFYFVFKLARKQDIVEANKKASTTAETKEK